MLYKVSRALQVIGMLLLPLAIAGNLAPDQPLDLASSLKLSGLGCVVFVVGYLLQQSTRPS